MVASPAARKPAFAGASAGIALRQCLGGESAEALAKADGGGGN